MPPSLQYHDWAAVADLYARATVSLNSRLHSGVLAAGSLRPLVYLSTNAKYLDFMSSVGLQAYIVDPSRCV
jgi:polysaccharide pyruvyl transferase WcaK-like protein